MAGPQQPLGRAGRWGPPQQGMGRWQLLGKSRGQCFGPLRWRTGPSHHCTELGVGDPNTAGGGHDPDGHGAELWSRALNPPSGRQGPLVVGLSLGAKIPGPRSGRCCLSVHQATLVGEAPGSSCVGCIFSSHQPRSGDKTPGPLGKEQVPTTAEPVWIMGPWTLSAGGKTPEAAKPC